MIAVQFTILQGVAQTNVYQETHTPTTDDNGLIIISIGEGTISDTFTDIDWASDDHFLNVQINTGNGLVDIGTTQFMQVPYAIIAANVKGLEPIDEGNGIGWRLVGRNPDNHGNIGENSIDLSYSSEISPENGATASWDLATGFNSKASGGSSTAMGRLTEATGVSSTAMGTSTTASGIAATSMGRFTEATGNYSTSLGHFSNAEGETSTAMGNNTTASGFGSTAIGNRTIAPSYAETVIGSFNTIYAPSGITNWDTSDRLFVVGNGTSDAQRSNALSISKSGIHAIRSASTGIDIISGGSGINISAGQTGIFISGPDSDGIVIFDSDANGINIDRSEEYGALISDTIAGVKASSSEPENPDIILAGNSSANNEDDGIISTDPTYPGSDLNLRSYGGIIAQLDYDDGGSGNFIVRNGDGNDAFSVSEGGTIRQNGSTIHSSDRRLKKDIENLEYGLNEVLKLQPKAYNWKDKEQTHKSLGLIAQEVQPIIKEIVTAQDNTDKTLGISYTELIPVLIKAIQEQQKIITNQNNKIDDMSVELVKIDSLDSRIKQLEALLNVQENKSH